MELNELVIRYKEYRDQEAFNEIFYRFYNNLYFVCYSYVKDEETAKDLVQSTFLQVISKIDTLENIEAFTKWIRMIACSQANDYLKKKKPILFSQLSTDDEDTVVDFKDDRVNTRPENIYLDNETKSELLQLIESLSDDKKITVMLFYYENMSISEIAKVMECKEGTVKSRLNSARNTLQEKIISMEKRGIRIRCSGGALLLIIFMLKENAVSVKAAELTRATVLDSLSKSLRTVSKGATKSIAAITVGKTAIAIGIACAITGLLVGVNKISNKAIRSVSDGTFIETPTTEAPTTEAPTTEAPTTEAPTVESGEILLEDYETAEIYQYKDKAYIIYKTSSGYGLIINGNKVLEPIYTNIELRDKYFYVTNDNEEIGLLDYNGTLITGEFWEAIRFDSERNFLITTDKTKQERVYTLSGKHFLNIEENSRQKFEYGILMNRKGDAYSFYNKDGEKIDELISSKSWNICSPKCITSVVQLYNFVERRYITTEAGGFSAFLDEYIGENVIGIYESLSTKTTKFVTEEGVFLSDLADKYYLYMMPYSKVHNGHFFAKSWTNNKYYLVNLEGENLLPEYEFDEIDDTEDEIVIVNKDGLYGIVDVKNAKVLEQPENKHIKFNGSNQNYSIFVIDGIYKIYLKETMDSYIGSDYVTGDNNFGLLKDETYVYYDFNGNKLFDSDKSLKFRNGYAEISDREIICIYNLSGKEIFTRDGYLKKYAWDGNGKLYLEEDKKIKIFNLNDNKK